MTVEDDIFDLLASLTSNRVYPDVAPQGATLPFIVFQQVGGEAINYIDNVEADKKHGRYQFAVWAATRAAAASIALQIESRMVTATDFSARPVGAPVADYEADTNRRGSRQDFSIWSTR